MHIAKLSEEQLRNIGTAMVMQRAENYIGRFFDCEMNEALLKGSVKGNHGVYKVKLAIDKDPLEFECNCETSKKMFCKHAAALGLTYIYTPWIFSISEKIERTKINDINELNFYIKTIKLKSLVEELKKNNIGLSTLSEITDVSIHHMSAVVKDDNKDKYHLLTAPLKLACLYLLEKNINKE